MGVGPEPQQDQVELRDALSEDVAELVLVGVGGRPRLLALALDPVDRRPRAADPVEERRLRHPVVRALVVRRDAAVVPPPQGDARPVHVQRGELLVGDPREWIRPVSAMWPPAFARLGEPLGALLCRVGDDLERRVALGHDSIALAASSAGA